MRKITILGLSMTALAASGWIATASAQAAAAPATAAPPADTAAPPADTAAPADTSSPAPKPVKHHMHSMKHMKMASKAGAGDAAVEDLNAKSLDAAKAGKSFTPSATPAADTKPAATPMKHHMHMKKKKMAAAPAADTSAPK